MTGKETGQERETERERERKLDQGRKGEREGESVSLKALKSNIEKIYYEEKKEKKNIRI